MRPGCGARMANIVGWCTTKFQYVTAMEKSSNGMDRVSTSRIESGQKMACVRRCPNERDGQQSVRTSEWLWRAKILCGESCIAALKQWFGTWMRPSPASGRLTAKLGN